MVWASQVLTVLRVWGVLRTLLVAVVLAFVVQLVATSHVGLPTFAFSLPVLNLIPPVAGLVLAAPLVDQTPELTLRTARAVPLLLLLRYLAVQAAGVIVVASLASTAWTLGRALLVVVFLGVSALSSVLLGGWYWVPLVALAYGWLLLTQDPDHAALTGAGVPAAVVGLLLGGGAYVAAGTLRSHRAG